MDLSTSSENEFPWPLPGDCSDRPWGSNYLAEATGAAFQDMYDNVNDMRSQFGRFWNKVASSFKDRDILGYEIINEPWAGNIYKDPSLLLPGNAGSKNLQPFYDDIQVYIRDADPDHIVFYEPVSDISTLAVKNERDCCIESSLCVYLGDLGNDIQRYSDWVRI